MAWPGSWRRWWPTFFHNEALVPILRTLSITLVISAISQVPITLDGQRDGLQEQGDPRGDLGGHRLRCLGGLALHGLWRLVDRLRPDHHGQFVLVSWFGSSAPGAPLSSSACGCVKEMWDYGKHIIGSQIMVFFITNIDDAFVGRFLGNAALGTYSLAYDLSNLPATHLSRIVGQVMFPAFTMVQHDLEPAASRPSSRARNTCPWPLSPSPPSPASLLGTLLLWPMAANGTRLSCPCS